MVVQTKKVLIKRFELLLAELMNSNIFTASECEVSGSEFNYFYDNEFTKFRADFESFNKNKDRLDQFRFDKVHIYKFEKLSSFAAFNCVHNFDIICFSETYLS